MASLKDLSEMAVLAFKNGLRLHFDSIFLLNKKSYPSSVMLSVLSMEEFGKYFSLSTYVFYTRTSASDTEEEPEDELRDSSLDKEYLEKLYIHPFKQRAVFGRDGFVSSSKLLNKASNRFFENLKQRSVYVGYERDKGKLLFDKGLTNPINVTKEVALEQVEFLNELVKGLTEEICKGIRELDEFEINQILNNKLLAKLNKAIKK